MGYAHIALSSFALLTFTPKPAVAEGVCPPKDFGSFSTRAAEAAAQNVKALRAGRVFSPQDFQVLSSGFQPRGGRHNQYCVNF